MSGKNTNTAVEAITAFLDDETITEIMVNSSEQVYVERNGRIECTEVRFADDQQIVDWANGLLASNGFESVGPGRPWVEGRLRDGSRLVVVAPPVAVSGPVVVIRKFIGTSMTFEQLLQFGSIDRSILDFLKVVMRSPLNILVSGATASGKTTFTNMITEFMPTDQRIVVVELANELRVRQEHVIYLEARASGASGDREISVSEILGLARQMRPDRVIVGELAGAESVEMLRMMNTGHEGTVAIIHAKSPRDALARLEKMVTVAEPSLTLPVIRTEIANAINLVFQLNRLDDGSRKVVSVAEVQGLKGDNIVLQELFVWEKTGVGENGRFTGKFKATGAVPSFVPKLETIGLPFPGGLFKA